MSIGPGAILPIAEFTKPLTATQRVTLNPVAWPRLGTGKERAQSVCALQDALRSRFTNGF